MFNGNTQIAITGRLDIHVEFAISISDFQFEYPGV